MKKILLSLVVLAFFASVAEASSWRTCDGKKQIWKSKNTTMHISTTSFPIGSIFDLHTQYSMSEWNADGANFNFLVGRDTVMDPIVNQTGKMRYTVIL
jgi:hypothetical protein